MGVTKQMISAGNGTKAKKGDTISMEYTGWVYDDKAADKKGSQYGEPSIDSIGFTS